MMKHRGIKNVVTAVLCLLCFGLGTGQAPAQNTGSDAASNVARVSFVQGSVQLLAGQGAEFAQAVINMPVLDGSRLQTGGDGQVEVEFGDGSVVRLTPNSSLQFGHLGQDQVQIQQLSGLGYYEFNVGEGHPPFDIQLANVDLAPTANSILRVGLDAGWEVAVITGSAHVQGNGIAPVDVAENQSIRAVDNNGAPYTIAQGINGDSWDNWNQDRDQAIAQEAAQQTPVRDDSANPQNENWNDLDANGNWYPVEGAGNVWVPAGVGPGWDPYGAGYWAYYPTFGYTWVSSYPWGWLPYHCGNWGYYGFGWGWAPGGCGGWRPLIVVRAYPPGWRMPVHPVYAGGGLHPLPAQRLVAVDRGPVAKGPWAFGGGGPRPDHQQALNFNGRVIAPVGRVDVRSQSFTAAKGTAPGTRAVLSGAPAAVEQRSSFHSTYVGGGNTPRGPAYPPQGAAPRPNVGYSAPPSYSQRSTYVARPEPSPHYSAPPQPHNSPPPESHPSAGPHR